MEHGTARFDVYCAVSGGKKETEALYELGCVDSKGTAKQDMKYEVQ